MEYVVRKYRPHPQKRELPRPRLERSTAFESRAASSPHHAHKRRSLPGGEGWGGRISRHRLILRILLNFKRAKLATPNAERQTASAPEPVPHD
jgi:hypothetical protein